MVEALGGKPTRAEQKVLAAAKAGDFAQLRPDGLRPDKPTSTTRIRAGLIRFLMLGGDDSHPVHPRGVMIRSAWITDELDLRACETQLDLSLWACQFESTPSFYDAHLGGLYLPGCHLPGLRGQRMQVEESLHLRELEMKGSEPQFFVSTGPVDIAGARINGQLACDGGQFDGRGRNAIIGHGIKVGASVFLRNGFLAKGLVNLSSGSINGQLSCLGGRFEGEGGTALAGNALVVGASVFLSEGFHATGLVSLKRAKISGQLACEGGRFEGNGGAAINADTLSVGSDVFLRDGFHATGDVNLTGARIVDYLQVSNALIEGNLELSSVSCGGHLIFLDVSGASNDGPWLEGRASLAPPINASRLRVNLTEARAGVLSDDKKSWEQVQSLRLSGFTYGSIQSEMSLDERLAVLDRATYGRRFDPGPYTRLSGVLRQAGHRVDASRVLFQREHRLRKAERVEARKGGGWGYLNAALMKVRDIIYGGLIGYSYRPEFTVFWSIFIITLSTFFFSDVYAVGQFAPNSDVILNSEHWLAAVERSDALLAQGYNVPPLMLWTGQTGVTPPMLPSIDYETFGPFLYAVDLFLPLDTIGQTEAWAPSKDRGGWGLVGYYARMPIQLMGWLITALVAALLTGLIGKRDD